MMQTTDFGDRDDRAEFRRLDWPSVGGILVEREVSARQTAGLGTGFLIQLWRRRCSGLLVIGGMLSRVIAVRTPAYNSGRRGRGRASSSVMAMSSSSCPTATTSPAPRITCRSGLYDGGGPGVFHIKDLTIEQSGAVTAAVTGERYGQFFAR